MKDIRQYSDKQLVPIASAAGAKWFPRDPEKSEALAEFLVDYLKQAYQLGYSDSEAQ